MIFPEIFMLTGAFLAGLVLGGIFFAGLWLTIHRRVSSAALGLWLVGSFTVRSAIVLLGFYVVSQGQWQRLAACIAGFILARFIVAQVVEASHAP